MNIKDWAKVIGINDECFKTIEENKLSKDTYTSLKDLWNKDFKSLYERLRSGEFSFSQILSFYFYLCYEYRINSGDKDIENGIFDAGMNNIEVWARDCYEKHGYYGMQDFGWTDKLLRKLVVRLGRLEFEPDKIHEDVSIEGRFIPKGTDVINVHIPATGPLDYEECKKSYKKCLEYYNLKEVIFVCESWLLSPLLDEMLPDTSNIIKFKNDWIIFKLDIMDRLFEERIFGGVTYDNPNLYVAKTTLQKKAKDIARRGRPLIGAWGVMFCKGE